MTEDKKDFVSKCEQFQRTNDNFTKPGSVLHPIPVEPEVWKQVNFHKDYTHMICTYMVYIDIDVHDLYISYG